MSIVKSVRPGPRIGIKGKKHRMDRRTPMGAVKVFISEGIPLKARVRADGGKSLHSSF